MLEAKRMMFEILLHERSLAARCGEEAAHIVRSRLYTLRCDLAYLERTEGRTAQARRQLFSLIREWPLRPELYWYFLKSLIPPFMATMLRGLRAKGQLNEGSRG
jgi:hypothetical protein